MSKIKINQIGPNIKVRNFEKSKKFYDALGFSKIVEFGPDCENAAPLKGIIYGFENVLFEIGEGHLAVKPEVFEETINSSKISMMVNVDSLIPVLDVCEENKIPIEVEPRLFPWGQIGLILKDPDGLILAFLSQSSETEIESISMRCDLPLERKEPDYLQDHLQVIAKKK